MCVCGLNTQRERKGFGSKQARSVLTVGSVSRLFGFIRAHGNNRHTVGLWIPPHPLESNQESAFTRGEKNNCVTDKYIYTPKHIYSKGNWHLLIHMFKNYLKKISKRGRVLHVCTVTSYLVIDSFIVTSSSRHHASRKLHEPYRCALPNFMRLPESYRMCMNSHTPPPVGLCVGMW